MNEIEKAIMDLQEYIGSGEYNGSNPPIYLNTANLAISALEKQLSRKPINQAEPSHGARIGLCPNCKTQWNNIYKKHCIECGQELDWSEPNEN